jgi:hypothetical protein
MIDVLRDTPGLWVGLPVQLIFRQTSKFFDEGGDQLIDL